MLLLRLQKTQGVRHQGSPSLCFYVCEERVMQVHWSLTVSLPLYTPPNLNTHNYYLHKSLRFLPQTPPFKNKCSLSLSHTHTRRHGHGSLALCTAFPVSFCLRTARFCFVRRNNKKRPPIPWPAPPPRRSKPLTHIPHSAWVKGHAKHNNELKRKGTDWVKFIHISNPAQQRKWEIVRESLRECTLGTVFFV